MSLPEKEVAEIRRTWAYVSPDLRGNGIVILGRYFKDYPEYQQKFQKLKDVSLEDLPNNDFAKFHAERIMKAFDGLIAVLEKDMLLSQMVSDIVRVHKEKRNVKDSPPYRDLFATIVAVLDSVLGKEVFNDDARRAWQSLAELFLSVVFEQTKC